MTSTVWPLDAVGLSAQTGQKARQLQALGTVQWDHEMAPLIAAAMAKAMPVLPDVGSMMVSPGFMTPLASASLIMLMAGLQRSDCYRA